jgi:RimJ/RimL family protein N-acetyltransferase
MANQVPDETIQAFAQNIYRESREYGFDIVAQIKLINSLMDLAANGKGDAPAPANTSRETGARHVQDFPLRSARLEIRRASASDAALIDSWCHGAYGAHFLLSGATAQRPQVSQLLADANNEFGLVSLQGGAAIGVVAFLDINRAQRRAELRKLIGVIDERGKGYAEEATALWVEYGRVGLRLEKVYVSTLQTQLSNIKLNESVGFRVEGLLRGEVRFEDERHDVLRMGLGLVPPAAEGAS